MFGGKILIGEDFKVAVVGLGKMGLVHASVLNVLPGVTVTAVCEKSRLIRRFARKLFRGVEVVDDVEKLEKLGINAVYVTTPIPSHFFIVKTVYDQKIASNIFVEKTLAQNYDQSKQLNERASQLGGVNMVGYLRRFYVTFNKARELLLKDDIGTVTSFRAFAYSSDFLGTKNELKTIASRGGPLRDLGCHAVDLALWFFGRIQVISGQPMQTSGHPENRVKFRVEGSALEGEFDISWCMEDYHLPEVGFSIDGSRGKLEVNDDHVRLILKNGRSSVWYRHDLNDNVPFLLGLPEYYREDLHFAECVSKGSQADSDFLAASKVDKIINDVENAGGKD
jgi:predicted dehydrogenase